MIYDAQRLKFRLGPAKGFLVNEKTPYYLAERLAVQVTGSIALMYDCSQLTRTNAESGQEYRMQCVIVRDQHWAVDRYGKFNY